MSAIDLLDSMSNSDFDDTIKAMCTSGTLVGLIAKLYRIDVVRLLRLVASKSARPTWEAVFKASCSSTWV